MKLEIYDMLQRGFAVKQANRLADQEAHPGSDWRGGNSGCITDSGQIIGYSPRTTVLRHMGVEMPASLDNDLMFEAGYKNEEHWAELLTLAEVPFKSEEEIPVKWALPNGETVGGRPDCVIGEPNAEEFTPRLGIEHKLISSNGRLVEHAHFANARPNAQHVCQAAHYSWKMGIDWVLAYTNRSWFFTFTYSRARFGNHRAMLVDSSGKTEKVILVRPFISMYNLTWEDGRLLVDGKPTIITQEGIQRYYQYCSDCVKNQEVPLQGGGISIWGDPLVKNDNVLYDSFRDAYLGNFQDWIVSCKEVAANHYKNLEY